MKSLWNCIQEKPWSRQISICCEDLSSYLSEKKSALHYSPMFREFYFNRRNPKSKVLDVIFVISYCPFCGNKLPTRLSDEWFDTLEEEYKIEGDIGKLHKNKDVPEEFTSDEWWKKRNL